MPRVVAVPGGEFRIADNGDAYYYVDVNGTLTSAGRYIKGRPDISTISDPYGPGGALSENGPIHKSTGTRPKQPTDPKPTPAGPSGPAPGQKTAAEKAMDDYMQWQYEAGLLNAAEEKAWRDEQERLRAESEAENDERYAESQRQYEEAKAEREKQEAEQRERNQYYNVQESMRAGLDEAGRELPLGAPKTVNTAMMNWANQLAKGFTAPMPIKPDVAAFLNYIRAKGFPTGGGG